MEAVDPAEDPEPLSQRARPRLGDARLAKVIAHAFEGFRRRRDAADQQWERGHEIDKPRKERTALQEVVVTLDQVPGWLIPRQGFELPPVLGAEPAPEIGADGEAVRRVRLED